MKILSIDTSMGACSAAVIDSDDPRPLAEAFLAMDRGHAEALAPMVSSVIEASGIALAEISRIAVTRGPGSFTGVRVGLAFARGLALSQGIPAIAIDTLSAIAANETAEQPLLVAADARNQEVYAAHFDAVRKLVSGPRVATAAQAADELPRHSLILGTAAEAVVRASGRSDLVISLAGRFPIAARFGYLAVGANAEEPSVPLYLRQPDAKPQTAKLRSASRLRFDPAPPSAAALLAEMHADAFPDGWTSAAFEDLLRMPGVVALLAFEHDEPVAFLLTRKAADEAEIITVGTRHAAGGRGIGGQLLMQQLAMLGETGVRQVFLEVAVSNRAALALYAKAGFREAGRRKAYYQRPEGPEDALILRKDLSS